MLIVFHAILILAEHFRRIAVKSGAETVRFVL